MVTTLIEEQLDAIRVLGREYGVARLEVFGSVCSPEFDAETSDVDFLVEYPADYEFGPWLTRFFALQDALTERLGRRVDLVMSTALRNTWFRREAEKMQ